MAVFGLIAVVIVSSVMSPAMAKIERPVAKRLGNIRASEWMKLPSNDRRDYIDASIISLGQKGVKLNKLPKEYYKLVENAVLDHPQYDQFSITSILVSVIYHNEPASRKSIDELIKSKEIEAPFYARNGVSS